MQLQWPLEDRETKEMSSMCQDSSSLLWQQSQVRTVASPRIKRSPNIMKDSFDHTGEDRIHWVLEDKRTAPSMQCVEDKSENAAGDSGNGVPPSHSSRLRDSVQHTVNSAPLVSLDLNSSSSLSTLLPITHKKTMRQRISRSNLSCSRPHRIPSLYLLPQTRRLAAATIIRWWRLKGERAKLSLVHAVELLQRVGRGYLASTRLLRQASRCRGHAVPSTSSVFVHSIPPCLTSLNEASDEQPRKSALGYPCFAADNRFNSSQSISCSMSRIYTSRSSRSDPELFGGSTLCFSRGIGTVGFDVARVDSIATTTTTMDRTLPVRKVTLPSLECPSQTGQDHRDGRRSHFLQLSPHNAFSHESLPRFSFISHREEKGENTESPTQAFCYVFNSRVSLEPLSVKVTDFFRPTVLIKKGGVEDPSPPKNI